MKNIVLDVNVILDLWLSRIPEAQQLLIAGLIADAADKDYLCWISSTSLPVLESLTQREMTKEGAEPEIALQKIRALLADLMQTVRPLSSYGFHQAEALRLSTDLEDAQIVLAAAELQGSTAIVTNEKRFHSKGKVTELLPTEVCEWLQILDDKPFDFIDLKTQQDVIRPKLEHNLHEVLHHGRYIMGPEVDKLEERLSNFVGVKHCIGVSSGTDALLIAMMALEVGPGDEIITTPFTFIATGEMIKLLGAKPVFVDIDPTTYNIDANKIEIAITAKTKAIIPVSLYGQCADFDAINAIAEKHGIPVIEDGAQSLGATYKGRQSCSLSTIGCTSFFPSKPLGGYGDAGACFTDDDNLAKLMREIRVHGQERHYHHPRIGLNGRMDSIQAAILLSKLEIFPHEVLQRAEAGERYTRLISENCKQITPPSIAEGNTSVFAQYSIQLEHRKKLQDRLREAGIPTAVHYPVPLHQQPALTAGEFDLQVAEKLSGRVMSLPIHPYLNASTQEQVIAAMIC